MVRSFGAKEWDVARLVVVPNSLPYIIAGLRLAIGRAVLGVVVAEFFGSESGLGVMMVQAAGRYQVDVVFSGLIVFAALSLVMTALVQVLENRLSRWRPQPTEAQSCHGATQSAVRGMSAQLVRLALTRRMSSTRSVRLAVELGRDVAHLLRASNSSRSRSQELLRVGQRLVRRPLLGGDHVDAARFEDLAEQVLGKLGAERVVRLLPDRCRRPCRRRRRDAP